MHFVTGALLNARIAVPVHGRAAAKARRRSRVTPPVGASRQSVLTRRHTPGRAGTFR